MQIQPKNPAFSLLELVLVLTLLGLAAGLTAPMLSRFSKGRDTLDAAAQLLVLMQYAQDQAATKGTQIRLQLDMQQQNYFLAAQTNSQFTKLPNEFGRTFSLVGKIESWDISPQNIAQQGYIQFDADGGHDVAVVRLVGRDAHAVFVGSSAPSEPFRIASSVQP